MSDNSLKNPLYRSLSNATQTKILDAITLSGKALPCHVIEAQGAMITVAFDLQSTYTLPQITIPLFGPIYIRYPIQPGDLGIVIPADARLGYTSGQGGGLADLSQPANLAALFFMPIGNATWTTVDPSAVTIYGPNGVVLRDTNSGAVVTLTPSGINCVVGSSSFDIVDGTITATTTNFVVNASNIELNGQLTQGTSGGGYPATLQGPVTVVHDVTANGTSVHTHVHSGVQTGSGDSGPPV